MTSLDSNPKKSSESVAPIKKVEICTQQHFVSLAYDRLVDLLAREERGSGQLVPSVLISLVEEYSKADVYLPMLRKIFETFLLIRDAINEYAEETLSGTDSSAVGIAAKLFCGAYLRSVYCFELDENVLWELLLGILEPSERASIEPVENVLRVKAFSIYRQGLHRLIDCLPSPYGGRRGEGAKSRVSFETFTRNILDKASKKRLYGPDDLACLIPLLDERMYFAFVCAPEGCWDRNPKHVSVAVPGNDRKLIIQKIWEAYLAKGIPMSRSERVAKLYTIYCILFDAKQDNEEERVSLLAKDLGIDQADIDQMLAERKIGEHCIKVFHKRLTKPNSTFWSLTVRPWNDRVTVDDEYRKKLPSEFVAKCDASEEDLCYHTIGSYPGGISYLCAIRTPSARYSILLRDEITEEIFTEPIDVKSHLFLTTVLIAHYQPTILFRSLAEAVSEHSKELLKCMLDGVDQCWRDIWCRHVFCSQNWMPPIEHSAKIAYCLKKAREENRPYSPPYWTKSSEDLIWAGIDPEIDLYMNFAGKLQSFQREIPLIKDLSKRREASERLARFMICRLIRKAILP